MTGALEELLAAAPVGTVSVWFGPLDGTPWFTHDEHAVHYAASTMKVPLVLRLQQCVDAGLDPDSTVLVHDEFDSVVAGQRYTAHQSYDNDDAVWRRLGEQVPLRWLATRAIVRSSNLATNLLLEQFAPAEVTEAWRALGARASVVARGIEDTAAGAASASNLVTAHDLAVLLQAIGTGRAASARGCEEVLADLFAQEYRDTFPAGLPPGTRVAHKNGWVDGLTHDAGIIERADGERCVLVACTSTELDERAGQEYVARVAWAAWQDWEGSR